MDVLNMIGVPTLVALVASQVVLGVLAYYVVRRQNRKSDAQKHREAA
jgi:hypothetical protein